VNLYNSLVQQAAGAKLAVYELDPLGDARWERFLHRHPAASVFHSCGWLDALQRTYGFSPIVYTTSPPGRELQNGIVLCRVASWLTGRRLVSVPFADHCEPLAERMEDRLELFNKLMQESDRKEFKFIELRPRKSLRPNGQGFGESDRFYLHTLDLQQNPTQLFRNFHKDSIQRRIRHAEREGIIAEDGNTEWHVTEFYRLLLLTRRRHQVPPQPIAWFNNLVTCLGKQVTIRLALHEGAPVAGILTLSFKNTLVYKYGCSDAKSKHLGGTPFLFWEMIQRAQEHQMAEVDFGRSSPSHTSMITFKERWGALRSELTYQCYPSRAKPRCQESTGLQLIKPIFARIPDRALIMAGRLLYPHIG